ncbi:hypothetical protein RJ641_018284 [Dillenia turbinata]|uniref:Uncharacterized protein n=1 Tax=Dillenia turbinata TaxID=194707 RepID=A0AAN8UXC4_9MAGN
MAKIVRNCLQSAMKVTNFSIGIVGMVIIFYSARWFMFGVLVMGTYAMIVLIFLLMEAMVTADICLNSNWVHDFPSDPTGGLDDFKNLIEHSEICKWVAFLNFASQGCSMLLSALLRCLDTKEDMDYYCNHEYGPDRLPLLNPVKPPSYVTGEPCLAYNEGLNVKVHL